MPRYNRVVLKLSGEALLPKGARYGIGMEEAAWVASEIASVCRQGIGVAIVVGGGNIFRGGSPEASAMNRVRADSMGMLATVINGMVLQEMLEKEGITPEHLTAINISSIAEPFVPSAAKKNFKEGKVLILSGGTGHPYFSTDTAAALRAVEIGGEAVFKGTKVDGVYDSDPVKNPKAKRFDKLTFDQVLNLNLKVMDSTSISMCRDNNLPIIVFDMFKVGNFLKAVTGDTIGTVVYGHKDS